MYVDLTFDQLIGRGAYADVWRAIDNLNRPVAVKFFEPGDVRNGIAEAHAGVLAGVRHDNVVRIYWFGNVRHPETGEERPALVMEYVKGRTLGEALANANQENVLLPEAAIRDISFGLLHGLDAIHKASVEHGDLHSANVLLDEQGRVRIIDVLATPSAALLTSTSKDERRRSDVRRARDIVHDVLGSGEGGSSMANDFLERSREARSVDDLIGTLEVLMTSSDAAGSGGTAFMIKRDGIVTAPAPPPAYLDTLTRESLARCVQRWVAAGVDWATARRLATDSSVGEPKSEWYPSNERPLVVLWGDFGAGKSLYAERMLQAAARDVSEGRAIRLPLYLQGINVTSSLRNAIIDECGDMADPRQSGIFVLIDDLDQANLSTADRVLGEARVLCEAWPNTRIVIASRPLLGELVRAPEIVTIPLLEEGEARDLVQQFAGHRRRYIHLASFPETVQDAVKRPLFAILLGLYLANENMTTPRSSADLLRWLVERSLGPLAAARVAVQEALEHLARVVTDSERGLSPAELRLTRQLPYLLETGLVAEQDGAITFGLPILTQWFAAHALLAGQPSVHDLLEDPARADRWRYPLAIGVNAFGDERIDDMLTSLAEADPALAAEIIGLGTPQPGLSNDTSAPGIAVAGSRLLRAYNAWAQGIGPLAPKVLPLKADGGLPTLGLRPYEAVLTTAWHPGDGLAPYVRLPEEVGAFRRPAGWVGGRSSRPGGAVAWPWRWSLEELRWHLQRAISSGVLVPEGSTMSEERSWSAACALLGEGELFEGPISVATLRSEIWRTLAHVPPGEPVTLQRSFGKNHDLRALEHRLEILEASSEPAWSLRRPGADLSPRGPFIWSSYSPQRLATRIETLFRQAVQDYITLTDEFFPAFRGRLRYRALLPARFSGRVYWRGTAADDDYPSLYLTIIPIAAHLTNEFEFGVGKEVAIPDFSDAAVIAHNTIQLRPETAEWLWPEFTSRAVGDFMSHNAVTTIATDWLVSDLKRIGWSE